MNIPDIIGIIIAIGVLVAGIGYAFSQFRQGSIKGRVDTIDLLSKKVDVLETTIEDQDKEIKSLTKEVHELRISVDEKDKKLVEYLDILKARNPEMQEIFTLMKTYIEANSPLLTTIKDEVIPVVKRLNNYLDKQEL